MSSAPENDAFRDTASFRRSLRESSEYRPVHRSYIDEFDYDDDFTSSVFDDEAYGEHLEFDPFAEYEEVGEVVGDVEVVGGADEESKEGHEVEEEEEGELLQQTSSVQLLTHCDVSEEVLPVATDSETLEAVGDDIDDAVSPSLLLIDRSQRNRARKRRRVRARHKKQRREERERKRAELQKKLDECQPKEQTDSVLPSAFGRHQVVPFGVGGSGGPQWMHRVSFETTSQFLEVVDTLRFWFAQVNETSGRRQRSLIGAPADMSILQDFDFPPRRDPAAAFAGQKLVVYGGYAGPKRTLKDTSVFCLRKLYGSLGVGGPIEYSLKLENEAWGTRARMSGRSKMVKLSEVSVALIDGESGSVPVIVDLQETTQSLRERRHHAPPKWKSVPIVEMRSAPLGREGFSAVAVTRKAGRMIYVFGGAVLGSRSGKKETNALYELRPARRTPNGHLVKTSSWSQVVEVFPIGIRPRPRWRYGAQMRRIDETEKWSECFARKKIPRKGRVGPCARSGHACCASGNSFFIFGGVAGNSVVNDLWRWSGRWTELVFSSGVPPPWLSHSLLAVPDARNVIVYGGETRKGCGTGGMYRFRLDTKRWTVVSPLQRPPQAAMTRFGSARLSPSRYALIGGWVSMAASSEPDGSPRERRLSDEIVFLAGLSNGHSFELSAHLEKKRRERDGIDINLIAGNDGAAVPAHKCILAARSPTLRETLSSVPDSLKLTIVNVDGAALEAYVSFLYSGDVKLSSLDEIGQFLDLASRFGHEAVLQEICRPGRPLTLLLASTVVRQMREDFFALFRDQSCFTDLEIVCQGEEEGGDLELFRCHRIFLTRSSFVNKALHSGMMEEVHGRLTFDTLSIAGLHQIVRYLYCDEVVGVDETTAVECHFFALLFKLPRIASVCRNVIIEMLTEETVPEILGLFAHTDAALRSACVRFLVDNGYEAFSRSSAFDDLESSVKLKVIDMFMTAQKRQKKQSTRAKNRARRERGRRW